MLSVCWTNHPLSQMSPYFTAQQAFREEPCDAMFTTTIVLKQCVGSMLGASKRVDQGRAKGQAKKVRLWADSFLARLYSVRWFGFKLLQFFVHPRQCETSTKRSEWRRSGGSWLDMRASFEHDAFQIQYLYMICKTFRTTEVTEEQKHIFPTHL